jgi:hypothetical protein
VDHFLYTVDNVDTVWTFTREHTKTLILSATTQQDSVTFTGWHTFYVKAVDNQGKESAPVELTFNAKTVAPQTCFTLPVKIGAGQGFNSPLLGGPSIRLGWEGRDDDGVTTKKPVGYILRRVSVMDLPLSQIDVARQLLFSAAAETLYLPGSINEYVFNNLSQVGGKQNWIFGIQGIDEAGAVEPTFRSPAAGGCANVFFFQSTGSQQGPALGIFSVALGFFLAQGVARDSAQYVFDRPVNLIWEADASEYGATVDGFRWGVDVQDLEDNNDPGWATGWSASTKQVTGLRFSNHSAPLHDIVVQARDSNGSVTTAVIRLTLVEFPLDRDLLFVDDEFENPINGYYPSNAQHQAFMTQMLGEALANIGRSPQVDVFSTFRGETYNDVTFPQLTDLAHYRTIVWDIGAPPDYNTFYRLTAVDPSIGPFHANILAIYLESGGNLLVSGLRPVTSTIAEGGYVKPPTMSPLGPKQGLESGDNNFAYDYWHIPNMIFFSDPGPATSHGLAACEPTEYARSHGFLGSYPRLELDATRWSRLATSGGPTQGEGFSDMPRTNPGVDFAAPLYEYVAAGGGSGVNASFMHGKYNCLIFKKGTTRPDREDWQYQVVYVPFRLYLMRPEGVAGMLTNVMYEFLNDKKWGASQVTIPQRAPRQVAPVASVDGQANPSRGR